MMNGSSPITEAEGRLRESSGASDA